MVDQLNVPMFSWMNAASLFVAGLCIGGAAVGVTLEPSRRRTLLLCAVANIVCAVLF